ncbi:MAG: hypothetical protein ACTMIR_01380 [Cellulomonadaceae bacterium]
MTFERLVRGHEFASKTATTAVGELGLPRPSEVVVANARISVETTAAHLTSAHDRAVASGSATLVYGLAVPFAGFEGTAATEVKPDFAVVAPHTQGGGSWLILGDAKDYERVRSRIDDTRMLKGFLQVAVGAESCAVWSRLPPRMAVHTHGVLAVPRNAFLQPQAVVEDLTDHREEVRLRLEERRNDAAAALGAGTASASEIVTHLEAAFDPASCATCTLFTFCREQLRASLDPADLLVELGVSRDHRRAGLELVDGSGTGDSLPQSVSATITASLTGHAQPTGRLRVDQAGQSGTINVVLAKSDAAALGVHGLSLRSDGGPWEPHVYDDPQSADTRRDVMHTLGEALARTLPAEDAESVGAAHLVVPDAATADILVSIADNLAGVELSRLRWERDVAAGRPALTFDGEQAVIPPPLGQTARIAVSFLLEADRARAFILRSAIIDLQRVLVGQVVPGGPAVNSGRLDYVVGWARTLTGEALDHRRFADHIESATHTPGARLTNARSDTIHAALTGGRAHPSAPNRADADQYVQLVTEELAYKADVLDEALHALALFPDSALRSAYRELEERAQDVWRRRLNCHASDLVRFGRTYRFWRNAQVEMIDKDRMCATQLAALSNPQVAHDLAAAAGTREVAFATVLSIDPVTIAVESRRIGDGDRIVMLTRNGAPAVEDRSVTIDVSGGSFRLDGMSIGPLEELDPPRTRTFTWIPQTSPGLDVGDRIVIARFSWFCTLKRNRYLNVGKPPADTTGAPQPSCTANTYAEAPEEHEWCCRPHEIAEARFADLLAERRERGELNPEAWPPVRDDDAFETPAAGSATGDPYREPQEPPPGDLTIDDLD